MKTRTVMHASPNPDEVVMYEIQDQPVEFETAEAHVELGGTLVILKNECVYHVAVGLGPTFSGLWDGCTYHIALRSWRP
jgi:hypothetical protein